VFLYEIERQDASQMPPERRQLVKD
jgi:hypothetical protein